MITPAADTLIADTAIAYGLAICTGLLVNDWADLDAAVDRVFRVNQGALGALSGAADEVEFYGDPVSPRERRKGWWF
jgi:hypothetical protein